jgi:hypothetical protein
MTVISESYDHQPMLMLLGKMRCRHSRQRWRMARRTTRLQGYHDAGDGWQEGGETGAGP